MSAETIQIGTEHAQQEPSSAERRSNTSHRDQRGAPSKRYPPAVTIREIRRRRGISLRKLATKADLLPAIVSQIETGRLMPNRAELEKLEEALSLQAGALRVVVGVVCDEGLVT